MQQTRGQGSHWPGCIWRCIYHGLPGAGKNHYRDGSHKKLLNAVDEEEKKLFFKEVALLNSLKHQSIVKFMAVCYQPLAMMLEYVYFDFRFFGQAVRVNTLSEFLLKIDEQNCDGFHDLVCHAATEIIESGPWELKMLRSRQ